MPLLTVIANQDEKWLNLFADDPMKKTVNSWGFYRFPVDASIAFAGFYLND